MKTLILQLLTLLFFNTTLMVLVSITPKPQKWIKKKVILDYH